MPQIAIHLNKFEQFQNRSPIVHKSGSKSARNLFFARFAYLGLLRPTSAYLGLPRVTSAYHLGLRRPRPTLANLGQPRPTSANLGLPRPTSANLGQPRPAYPPGEPQTQLIVGLTKRFPIISDVMEITSPRNSGFQEPRQPFTRLVLVE